MARTYRKRAFFGAVAGWSDAYMRWEVSEDSVDLKITDCDRAVNLSFLDCGIREQDKKKYLKFNKMMNEFFMRGDERLGVTEDE